MRKCIIYLIVFFVFGSMVSGFTQEAEAYCRSQGIACSDDERWLGNYCLQTN